MGRLRRGSKERVEGAGRFVKGQSEKVEAQLPQAWLGLRLGLGLGLGFGFGLGLAKS